MAHQVKQCLYSDDEGEEASTGTWTTVEACLTSREEGRRIETLKHDGDSNKCP